MTSTRRGKCVKRRCALLMALLLSDIVAGAEQAPEWLGNQIGVDSSVPPPWTPLQVGKAESERQKPERIGRAQRKPSPFAFYVECWGRRYVFDGTLFPTQVVNQGKPMLAAPMLLVAQLGKRVVGVEKGAVRVVSQAQDKVVLESQGNMMGVKVQVRTLIEFDGMMRFDITFTPSKPLVVEQLSFDIPLNRERVKYFYHEVTSPSPALLRTFSGKVLAMGISRPFVHYFWVGDEYVGLFWFAQSPLNWRLERKDRAVQIVSEARRSLFRLNLIDCFTPHTFRQPFTITFGLVPGPMRPMPNKWRKVALNSFYYPEPREHVIVQHTKFDLVVVGGENKWYAVPILTNRGKEWVDKNHEAGIRVIPYCNFHETSTNLPEWEEFKEEWYRGLTLPPGALHWGDTVFICSFPQSRHDFYIFRLIEGLRTQNIGGFYFDIVPPVRCENKKHTTHRYKDPDGITRYPLEWFTLRESYKRVWKAAKRIKPDCIIVMHGFLPVFPFCDAFVTGEHFIRLVEDNYVDVLSADDMRGGVYRGVQYGIPPVFLPELRGREDERKPTRTLLALTLLHDVALWEGAYSNREECLAALKVKSDFEVWDAEFLPYFENSEIVKASPADVKVSFYRRGDKALFVISNLGRANVEAKVVLMPKMLFPQATGDLRAMDAFTKEKLKMELSQQGQVSCYALKLPVDATDFRIVELTSD